MLLFSSRSGVLVQHRLSSHLKARAWRERIRFLSAKDIRRPEVINLKIGGSGTININISHPVVFDKSLPRNVLVQFPPGPVPAPLHQHDHGSGLLNKHLLLAARLSNVTFVQVNYRLSTQSPFEHCFPTPVHDSTSALEFLTSSTSQFNYGHSTPPKICLTGSHIGGGLATMLALTEPDKIHAIAVTSPMVDWVSLDEIQDNARAFASASNSTLTSRRRHAGKAGSSGNIETPREDIPMLEAGDITRAAKSLINLRGELFHTPSSYFDPFASPVLFLRAPGKDTPLAKTAKMVRFEYEAVRAALNQDHSNIDVENTANSLSGMDLSSDMDAYGPYDDDWQASSNPISSSSSSSSPSRTLSQSFPSVTSSLSSSESTSLASALSATDETTVTTTSIATPPKRRKVLRRWPPTGRPEDVLLPHVRIFLPDHNATSRFLPGGSNDQATSPSTTTTTAMMMTMAHQAIQGSQGTELAELMRRACFFGREKGFAEERVGITYLRPSSTVSPSATIHQTEDSNGSTSSYVKTTGRSLGGGDVDDGSVGTDIVAGKKIEEGEEEVLEWLQTIFDEE